MQGDVYRQLVNTTAQFMQATEESVPLSVAVAVSMFIAEEKVNNMVKKANEDEHYRRQFASAIKRGDKEELVRLSEAVRG